MDPTRSTGRRDSLLKWKENVKRKCGLIFKLKKNCPPRGRLFQNSKINPHFLFTFSFHFRSESRRPVDRVGSTTTIFENNDLENKPTLGSSRNGLKTVPITRNSVPMWGNCATWTFKAPKPKPVHLMAHR